ncbi:uncharacterized protein LOC110933482 [Helianthus annuus]|uniref:uncharacterized protein LOC110933482 n=1 Tax=Helianthus annuus TaxID=4232 RepID=UPI000B8EF723|nr:uncharacterized protein LOC110933482 [Helianthus annuus]
MSIVRSSRASVLVNGSLTFEFTCQRGLRQGDPLSTFLFILAMEALTRIMRRACHLGVFHGIQVGGSGPLISHFIYADDVVFCGEWSIANAKNLRRLLRGFYLISGVRISSNKSCVYGVGVEENEIMNLATAIHFLRGFVGSFFWGGTEDVDKLNWLAWDKVVSPVKYGGVGLGALRDANLSLLSKWWWRFKTNQNALWRKVVWSIHGSGRGWNCIPVKLSLGGIWKQIASVSRLLGNFNMEPHKLIKANLRSGTGINFWLDWWIADDTLQNLYPLLFNLEKNKSCLVSDRVQSSLQGTQLKWEWRRSVFSDVEQVKYAEMLLLLSAVSTMVRIRGLQSLVVLDALKSAR